jgi:hypothetical protein
MMMLETRSATASWLLLHGAILDYTKFHTVTYLRHTAINIVAGDERNTIFIAQTEISGAIRVVKLSD